ncbi:ATP-binding protein [Desulfocurvibacter africanus]|uniref:ATP-binding protein n=1 Tax=Desulfocurvibacter africanus TaxID=873 RepID=UPI002FD9C57E
MAERHIILSGYLTQLEKLSRFVDSFGREHDLPTPLIFELNLALDELVTNIITHGSRGGDLSWISVSLCRTEEELLAVVEDDGQAFDPCQAEAPDLLCSLEERCIGGLGIHLVRNLTDAMCYERIGDRNRITLVKKAKPSCG